MGADMKNKCKIEQKRIENTRGIASSFIKQRESMTTATTENKQEEKIDNVDSTLLHNDIIMEELLETMLKLIKNRSPISDDLLLICWKHEMKQHPLESDNRLWKALEKSVENVLSDSNNKRNWIWLSRYILSSVVWYELVTFGKNKANENFANIVNNNNNKNNIKSHIKMNCDCGHLMDINSTLTMAQHSVECSKCKNIINNDFVYYCPKKKIKKHPNGFYLCHKCGANRVRHDPNGKGNLDHQDQQNRDNYASYLNTDECVLYEHLTGIADDGLLKHKHKLKEKIDSISNQKFWKMMTRYQQSKKERIQKMGAIELRQDCGDYLTFPNKIGMDIKKLEKLNLKEFYCTTIYLGNLMMVANAMNDKFHDVMQNDIYKQDLEIEYVAGPVKRIERCLAKAETVLFT